MIEKKDVNPNTNPNDIIPLFKTLPPGGWPVKFHEWGNVQAAFRIIMREYIENHMEPYPENFSGRGIVICGGLTTRTKANLPHGYIPSMWVALNKIRMLGCNLPIEIWHMGHVEMDPNLKRLFNSVIQNVTFRDAREVLKTSPSRMMAGWELKTYAAKNTMFEEFIQMDADNAPHQIDLTEMFSWREYLEHGSIFWPDFKPRWPFSHAGIYGVMPFPDEFEFESGQMVINKRRCWTEVCLSHFLSEYSDYTYKTFYGDKEAFHLGWRILGSSYGMPMDGPGWKIKTILQYAPREDGEEQRIVWLHRCQGKFQLHNSPIFNGIPDEAEHHNILAQLPRVWSGRAWYNHSPNQCEQKVIGQIIGKVLQYTRYYNSDSVMDTRPMLLDENGVIGVGSATCEASWSVWQIGDFFYIAILHQDNKLTALLRLSNDRSIALGWWEEFERCKVTLTLAPRPPHSEKRLDFVKKLTSRKWNYIRLQDDDNTIRDQRPMAFAANGLITNGMGGCERTWEVFIIDELIRLVIKNDQGETTCQLAPDDHDDEQLFLVGRWLKHERCKIRLEVIK